MTMHVDNVNEVTKSLQNGAEEAFSWITSNGMSANADKCQAMLDRKDKKALQEFHS